VLTVHVLGPVEVHRDGRPLELGGPQQRAVIAHLAIDAGRIVSVERLIDRLWGDQPPRTPLGTLQSYVSRLRRALEQNRGAGAVPEVLVSEAPGYVLRLPPEQIDVHQFRALVADARAAAAAGDDERALSGFDAALALWRGPALAGVGPEDQVRSIVVRLDEEREAAIEERFEALLALGRHDEAIPLLQTAVDEQPLRERLWALLALALYRSSRQADALRAVSTVRAILLDELGLDPGPELRGLEIRILAQDPTLALAIPEHAAPAAVAPERAVAPRVELVERNEEWTALTRALAGASEGGPHLALIEGEPGIGKSTLCDAFLLHAASLGWRTAVGRCVEPGLGPSLCRAVRVADRRTRRESVGDPAGRSPLGRPGHARRRSPGVGTPGHAAGARARRPSTTGDRPRFCAR
jgi:DNA-binding SARP family transcriptional activator